MTTVNNSLSKRAQRARETRRRMLESAHELFLNQGYPATTMTQIADAAGVAVQTLYYSFQTKGKLLIEVVEVAGSGGDDPVPVPERAWFKEMMTSTNAQRMLALVVEHGTEIYERVADLWPIILTALSDADVAAFWEGVATGRQRAQRGQVAKIAEMGALKDGLSVEQAGDLMVLLSGHAPYRSLVQDDGWSMVDYKSWLFTTLVQQLLDESIDRETIADLSFADRMPF